MFGAGEEIGKEEGGEKKGPVGFPQNSWTLLGKKRWHPGPRVRDITESGGSCPAHRLPPSLSRTSAGSSIC